MTPAEMMLFTARAELKIRQDHPRHWNGFERDGLIEAEQDLVAERVRTLEQIVEAETNA